MAKVIRLKTGEVLVEDTEDESERLGLAYHRRIQKHLRDHDPLSLHNRETVVVAEGAAPESTIDAIVDDHKRKARARRRAKRLAEEAKLAAELEAEIAEIAGPDVQELLDLLDKKHLF